MITLIAARDRNGAIGKDNTIPWYAPEDLAFFQRETRGGALIMGRNTWDSLPVRPLKGRLNIVVSSQGGLGEICCASLQEAIEAAHAEGYRRIYGMGGQRVYQDLLPLAHRLLVTEVDIEVEAADTYFPEFGDDDWACIGTTALRDSGPKCTAYEYLRRENLAEL
jgi:dihydrofolate reductase